MSERYEVVDLQNYAAKPPFRILLDVSPQRQTEWEIKRSQGAKHQICCIHKPVPARVTNAFLYGAGF